MGLGKLFTRSTKITVEDTATGAGHATLLSRRAR
jgi:hypothetical protein